jgi:hypothetical protein
MVRRWRLIGHFPIQYPPPSPQISRPDAAEGGTRVRPMHMTVELCACTACHHCYIDRITKKVLWPKVHAQEGAAEDSVEAPSWRLSVCSLFCSCWFSSSSILTRTRRFWISVFICENSALA